MDNFYIHPKIAKLYKSMKSLPGMKRLIGSLKPKFKYSWIVNFDNKLIYPLYKFLKEYLAVRTIYHYGADYRWNDLKSQNLDIDNFNLGYGSIHYSIIRNQRPKRILCIGSMYGFVPYMMAKACMENRKGHVAFVDAGYDMQSKKDASVHYYGQGFWKKVKPHKHFNYLLSPEYITSYIQTTKDYAKKNKHKFDYIYLDGDHSYEGVVNDIKLFWPLLKKDGLLCLHDIHFKQQAEGLPFEHWKAWNELIKRAPYKLDISNNYSGLGFTRQNKNVIKGYFRFVGDNFHKFSAQSKS